ncbi:trypsin-like peptidase domain-containing protein [Iamia majanohamensis]|uniref:Trypsin-like peptidase domain-containing protein n=1 Tax=Iamia majanohamensis TaxID=467976 RepID=A0AAF0BU63_9ACTN|nr:trypsin-like peptidase domain-containing protein [Iamia majanohamensis]WCO67522.1 trypsin-like peptidase domain-containing protein [Iamia majanohamensis]
MPPYPPGYAPVRPEPAPGGGSGAGGAGTPPTPSSDRGGRLTAALVGGIVGAVVAALVASGLVLATDDGDTASPATTTTSPPPSVAPGEALDIQQLLDVAQPSVVSIDTGVSSQPGATGAGSGFILDAAGLILTNAHVIQGADEISVTFFDGSSVDAELVGSFPEDDVAMIRVEGKEDLRAASLGSSTDLQVGEDVVAIGNALGLGGQPTVTSGIVSAKDRPLSGPTQDGGTIELDNLIQTDAAINPGNSGGPLLNARGEVVGINTAVIPGASNIGFALSIDPLRPLIEELRNGDGDVNPDQAVLGVTTIEASNPDLPPEVLDQFGITRPEGLIVDTVSPDSGAAEAGLQRGDVILVVEGQTTDTQAALSEVIRSKAPGDTIAISYEREGVPMETEATLTRRGG